MRILLLKNIPIAHHGTSSGQWPRTSIESRELGGKTLGLLGFGVIGKKGSRLAQVFGAKVIAYDPFVPESEASKHNVSLVEQEDLFSSLMSFRFTFHLTDQTRDLINAQVHLI